MSDRDIDLQVRAKALLGDAQKQIDQFLKEIEGGAKRADRETSFLGRSLSTAAGTLAGFVSAQAIMRGVSAAFGFAKEAVFGMNATLETATLQFQTLMGNADLAREHVLSLFEFAKETPFETEPIIQASRLLRTFGGDVLDTAQNLTLIGDAAAGASIPINEVAFWIGRAYSMIQGGKPFGEAAMRLQELAILSPQARDQMEQLQKAGADSTVVWQVLQGELGKFSGSMQNLAGTWSGVTSTFSDTINLLLADTFKPFFEVVRDGLGRLNDALGTDGVQRAMDAFKQKVMEAFGNDPKAAVDAMSRAVISFGRTTLSTFEGVYRAARFVIDGFSGIAEFVLDFNQVSARAFANWASIYGRIDPSGKIAELGKEAEAAAKRSEELSQWLEEVGQSSEAAWKGNDAFVTLLRETKGVLDAAETSLGETVVATNETAAATTRAGAAAQQMGNSFVIAGETAAQAAKRMKKEQEDAYKRMLVVNQAFFDQVVSDELAMVERRKKNREGVLLMEQEAWRLEYEAAQETRRKQEELDKQYAALRSQIANETGLALMEADRRALESKNIMWREHFGMLSKSFAELGQIGIGVLTDLTRGIGTVTSAVNVATKGIDSLKLGFMSMTSGSGLKSILGGLGSMVGGVGAIASAATAAIQGIKALWNSFKSEESRKVNSPRDQFIAQFGGDIEMGNKILKALEARGLSYEEAEARRIELMDRGLYDADTEKKFKAAQARIVDLIGGNTFRQGTPGLGFVDFKAGQLAELHGREAIVPEHRAEEFARRFMAGKESTHVADAIDRLRRDLSGLVDLPGEIRRAVRDGVLLAV